MKNINNNMSFPNLPVRQGLGNLPLSMLLIKEEKQSCFIKQVEDPRQKPSGMTTLFNNGNGGFTLIELLVVVLIIGILAAVALPQYQKAVEKARMTEAITLVRAIANANQVFYMANGRYAEHNELELLDIEIPGSPTQYANAVRVSSKYFMYSPNGYGNADIALAQRLPIDATYVIYVPRNDTSRIRCRIAPTYTPTAVQRKLCEELNTKGTL